MRYFFWFGVKFVFSPRPTRKLRAPNFRFLWPTGALLWRFHRGQILLVRNKCEERPKDHRRSLHSELNKPCIILFSTYVYGFLYFTQNFDKNVCPVRGKPLRWQWQNWTTLRWIIIDCFFISKVFFFWPHRYFNQHWKQKQEVVTFNFKPKRFFIHL